MALTAAAGTPSKKQKKAINDVDPGVDPRNLNTQLFFTVLLKKHPFFDTSAEDTRKPYADFLKQTAEDSKRIHQAAQILRGGFAVEPPAAIKQWAVRLSQFSTATARIDKVRALGVFNHEQFIEAGIDINHLPSSMLCSSTGRVMDLPTYSFYTNFKLSSIAEYNAEEACPSKLDAESKHLIEYLLCKLYAYGKEDFREYVKRQQQCVVDLSADPMFELGVKAFHAHKYSLAYDCLNMAGLTFKHHVKNPEKQANCLYWEAMALSKSAQDNPEHFKSALEQIQKCINIREKLSPKPEDDITAAKSLKKEIQKCQKALSLLLSANVLFKEKKYKDALPVYQKALSEHPQGTNAKTLALMHYCLGSCFHRLGDIGKAIINTRVAFNLRKATLGETHKATQGAAVKLAKLSALTQKGASSDGGKKETDKNATYR